MAVASPCISVCKMNATSGWCEGCYRTIDEIIVWAKSSDEEKLAIWQQLPRRHAQAQYPQALLNQSLMQACKKESP